MTSDELRFGRIHHKIKRDIGYTPWDDTARERYRKAISERLQALKALAQWRGKE